jgi:hypothetical protein
MPVLVIAGGRDGLDLIGEAGYRGVRLGGSVSRCDDDCYGPAIATRQRSNTVLE